MDAAQQPGPSGLQGRVVPPAPQAPPTRYPSIIYSTCNAMEKRILKRRPLNLWAVLCLKKPSLRRFLRANGQRYKAKDKKTRLVHIVSSMISRHEIRTRDQGRVASQRANPTRPASQPRNQHFVERTIPTPCLGPTCTCITSCGTLLTNRYIYLLMETQTRLNELLTKNIRELKSTLLSYQAIPSSEHCRLQLLRQIRDQMESEVQAQQAQQAP